MSPRELAAEIQRGSILEQEALEELVFRARVLDTIAGGCPDAWLDTSNGCPFINKKHYGCGQCWLDGYRAHRDELEES
jgi:hypothetical protein